MINATVIEDPSISSPRPVSAALPEWGHLGPVGRACDGSVIGAPVDQRPQASRMSQLRGFRYLSGLQNRWFILPFRLVLTAPHPSPLSTSRGFFGCRHFSRANRYLKENGQQPIDWSLPMAADMGHI